jgi:hypothetical protein
MTRKSKREIERALADLERVDRPRPLRRSSLEESCDDAVVDFVHHVIRNLHQIQYRHPDSIVNAPSHEAITQFLERVRDEYGIEKDRDEDVRATLAGAGEGINYWNEIDSFAVAPATVARRDPATGTGELLSDLVAAGDDDRAERLLIQATYDTLADLNGGRGVVVT